jgi:hypothetical protein
MRGGKLTFGGGALDVDDGDDLLASDDDRLLNLSEFSTNEIILQNSY